MKHIFLLLLFTGYNVHSAYAQTVLQFEPGEKQRVFVLTDITNEPDDQQSLVRLLVYANEYDIEGLVATTSTHLRDATRKEKIDEVLNNYAKVKPVLDKHAAGYPSKEYLNNITTEHLPLFGMDGVGEGKDSPGSEMLIKAVDKEEARPLWVSVWGGANCLAQALWKVRTTRTDVEVQRFVDKIRVYSISDQDNSGQWVRHNFPGIFYIVDASAGDAWQEYYKATWTGISGDRFYKNGPLYESELVENSWLKANIMENHGPLGANYLEVIYIMEGDTPAFFGLIQNGLGWYKSPAWGGWGGRYDLFKTYAEVDRIWTSTVNSLDEVELSDGRKEASNQATIWRWRKAFQHDFAARMDWNVADDFKKANHNPILVLNGNRGTDIAMASLKAGEKVIMSAKGSSDPDGDKLKYKWWIYAEAGSFTGKIDLPNPGAEEISFSMPALTDGQELHVILEVEDAGSPSLTSYRRVVLRNPE